MGKKLRILGFLASLCLFAFSSNAFAAGYSCTKTYNTCNAGYYLSNGDCNTAPSGWTCPGGTGDANTCYKDVTLSKNGRSVNLGPTTPSGPSDCFVVTTATGTNSATLRVFYNTSCTLPTYTAGTEDGYYYSGWSTSSALNATAATTIPATTTAPTATYYMRKSGCADGYYKDGTSCSECPPAFDSSSNNNLDGINYCNVDITLHKNGFSGTLDVGTANGNNCYVVTGGTGTTNGTLRVYYDTECTLPTINWTQTGYPNATQWATSNLIDDDEPFTSLPASTTRPGTLYAYKSGCLAGYTSDGPREETCYKCPTAYPDSDTNNNTRGNLSCYTIVTRGCTQDNGSTPTNCDSVTSWNDCSCDGDTYKQYANATGTGNGPTSGTTTNETCLKTPAAVTAKPNYYVYGTTCPACNVSFTDNGSDTTSTDTCADGSTTKSNATATSQAYTRTCYHQTSSGGNITSSSCTGTQNCGTKTYGTCVATSCATGYSLSNGACVANTYRVTYDCGDATGGTAPTADTATYNANYTPKTNTCTKTNYEFSGWKVSGTTDIKSAGTAFKWTYTSDKTLIAQWTQNAFNVTYNLNSGSGTTPAQTTCSAGVSCTLASGDTNSFYRAGYVFNGWATSASATSGSLTITITKAETVYAVWTPCAIGKYKTTSANANAACETCPSGYPNTESTATTLKTLCFSGTKQRPSTGAHNEVIPNGCSSATFADCTPATCDYFAYSNDAGTGDGTIKSGCETNTATCNKTVVAPVVAAANYFASTTATSCTACSASNSSFPYSQPGTTDAGYCYRNCTTSDVANSTEVSGTVTKNGTKTCVATACDDDYRLTDAGGCASCPNNANCNGTSTWDCEVGYEKSNDQTYCVPLQYTVTLNKNASDATCSGSCATSVTATYGEAMPSLTTSGKLPTRANWSFAGYFDDQTGGTQYYSATGASLRPWNKTNAATLYAHWSQNVETCQAGKYYNGTSHVDCPSGMYCPGTGTALQGSAGCYVECTTLGAEYTASDLGSTTSATCYKTCNTAACVNPCTTYNNSSEIADLCTSPIPTNATGSVYDTQSTVAGIAYYGSNTCVNINNTVCALKQTWCKNRYFENTESRQCESCSTTGYGQSIYGNTGGACGTCYTTCSVLCTPQVCPDHNSTCTQNTTSKTSGADYYCDGTCDATTTCGCNAAPSSCPMSFECQGNYNKNATNATCDPKIYALTLNDNGGTGGSGTVYEKYSVGWSLTNFGTTVTKVTVPTWENHTFVGYYTAATGGTQVIDANGNLAVATTIGLSDTAEGGTASTVGVYDTLYARWSTNMFTCTAGQKANGDACPEGFYCPGGQVPYEDKDNANDGCHKTCPTDAAGGTPSSTEGSSLQTQCYTTRTNVALGDGTGAGNQKCFYKSTTQDYSDTCTISITSCSIGHYRESETSVTCAVVGRGAWSPANDIEKHLCSTLTGANSTVTTEGDTSGAATACYNTCSTISIANGSRNPVHDKENYNGTQIPACTYTTSCNTGYGASGETCTPNVYEITLDHNNSGCTSNCTTPTSPIYLKYATGWYQTRANANAGTNAITSVTRPNWPGKSFSGYFSTSEQQVVDADGKLTEQFTMFTNDATVTASWEQKPTVSCAAGTYYTGNGTTCTDCPAGSYCGGTTPVQDTGVESGRLTCPTGTDKYTPANAALTVTITSPVKSDEISDCYATNVAYSASQGAGSQTCSYNAASGKYIGSSAKPCTEIQILTCTTGHWLDTSKTSTDCSEVTQGYYSPNNATTRKECPNRSQDNTITTQSATAGSVQQCYRGNIWYEPVNGHSGHRRNCYHTSDESDTNITTGYTYNCDQSVIVTCDAGYYDDGSYLNSNNERDCKPVGKGKYSPAQSACTGEETKPSMDNPGCSTQVSTCPVATGMVDVTSTTPTTETTTSDDITDCYLTCNPTKNLNGTIINVVNSPVHYNTTKNAYNACIYDSNVCPADMWCDTDGFHDCPDDKDGIAGKADLAENQKYRGIETCYILYNPWPTTFSANYQATRTPWGHGTGWVKAFYQGTETNGDYTNYYNLGALTCDAGYYYDAAMTCSDVHVCHYSPAQTSFSGETPTMTNPGSSTEEIECPVGCSGSATNASNYTQCYKACPENVSDFPHSKTVASIDADKRVFANSATTYPACKYNITCNTGYDVQNNGTATPSCVAHTYTITLNKNGGTGSTATSVQCTFDSGACALPAIVDTRAGYSTTNKWCTSADGSGTCYNAGTSITTNISSDATDTVLYAQWTPNVYTITLNHNGATTAGAPATVYLKYATGWYSNATATTAISQLTTKPVKGVMVFVGYKGNNVTVIGADGKFVTTETALTFTTANVTVTAEWADAPITCPEGTYYKGTGEVVATSCLECTENHFCPGVTVNTNSGQSGLNACPDSGKSPTNSTSGDACYKELLPTYVATHGKGTQTCYYDESALTYSSHCKDFVITTCDGGYWLATATDTDCTAAGTGYYSTGSVLTREQCPNGGTTNGTTKTSIQDCFKTGLVYTADDTTGTGTQSCWYTSGTGTSAVYSRECFDKKITACRGGYYRANNSDIVCTEVGYNYYSNEGDITRQRCEGQGKTRDKATVTVDLCYEDGLDYVAEHGGGSQTCFWNTADSAYNIGCGDKTITYCNAGYWLANQSNIECSPVDYAYYSPNRDLARYACPAGKTTETATSASESDCFACPADSVCQEDQGPKTCSDLTSGQYTKSDAGTTDVAYCYKACALATNASAMSGRDYYTAEDTCAIATCQAGYAFQNGACVPCPEGSFCDGNGGGTGGNGDDGAQSCADLGDGSWLYSAIGATSANDCYKTCVGHVETICTLTPVDSKAYWPNDCQYTGTSATGNPADVINGVCVETDCNSNYEMVNGACRLCNRENALSYKPDGNCIVESCVIGYHPKGSACEEDIVECTNTAPNAVYAEQKWDKTRGAFGICTIKSCEDDYHLSSNTCVPNEQVCNIANGVGTKTWNTTTNSWNACVATSCVPGYTNDPAEKNNASEQCSECRNKFSVLGEVAASSYVRGCEIASCMYQGEKYNLEDNECVPICDRPYSDETGSLRWNESTKKCERTCNPGYISW